MMNSSPSSSSNNQNENLSTKLSNLSIDDLSKRDCFGNTILHLICKTGKIERLKSLLKNKNLNLLTTDLENGWNCLHLTIFHKHIVMANLIIQFASSVHKLEPLLKQKDREGLTPMDLLMSEIEIKRLKIFPVFLGGLRLPQSQKSKYSMKEMQVTWWEDDDDDLEEDEFIDVSDELNRKFDQVITYSGDVLTQVDLGYNNSATSEPLEIVEKFKKFQPGSVHMSNKHSVISTDNGVFVSGFGSKGRLGLGGVKNYLDEFVRLPLDSYGPGVAVSNNHTLILVHGVFGMLSFGSNEFGCLGVDDTISESLSPVSIPLKVHEGIRGVCCSNIHSICYSTSRVWFWGLNIGQMGFTTISNEQMTYKNQTGFIGRKPQELKFEKRVQTVVCSEFATLVFTFENEAHLYMNGFHAKFQPPQYNKTIDDVYVFKPRALTSRIYILKLVCRNNHVLILYDNGNVLQFTLNQQVTTAAEFLKDLKYTRVWRAKAKHLKCVDADVADDGSIILCVKDGSVYKGVKRGLQKKKALFKFTRLSNVTNIVSVATDPDFKKFMFIAKERQCLPFILWKNKFYIDSERLSLLGPDKRENFGKPETIRTINRKLNGMGPGDPEVHMGPHVWNFLPGYGSLISTEFRKFPKNFSFSDMEDLFNYDKDVTILRNRISSSEWLERKLAEYPPTEYYIKSSDDILIPIHKPLLYDIETFKRVFDGEVVNANSKSMYLSGNVINVIGFDHKSVICLLHYLYTGRIVLWKGEKDLPLDIKNYNIKAKEFIDFILPGGFEIFKLVKLIDSDLNDTVIYLKDGSSTSYSFLLHARSTYFEALFNWKRNKLLKYEVDLKHIEKEVFLIILKYLHGDNPLKLFDPSKFSDVPQFLNFVISCIEAADELLLTDLKDLLEYYVSRFIDVHNVLLIMRHAFELKCTKLLEGCFWHVYLNLPLLIFDEEFNELVNENNFDFLKRMDYSFKFFHHLKKDFNYTWDNWYEKNPDNLIRMFLYEIGKYNEIFNSKNFEPIFEIVDKKDRKQQPQSSPVTSVLMNSNPSSILEDNSAILDDKIDEEVQDWKVFTKRRRSSATRKLSMNGNNFDEFNNVVNNNNNNNSAFIIEPSSASKSRQNSVIELILESADDDTVKSKPKIKIQKSSQRERKKSLLEQVSSTPMSAESSSSRSVTPVWNINTPSKKPKQTTPINSPTSSSLGTPSLSEIMFEQEALLNPAQKPVKSLLEIQEQEEFERWFNEESLRYQEREQQELRLLQNSSKSKSKKKTKGNKMKNTNNNDQRRSSS